MQTFTPFQQRAQFHRVSPCQARPGRSREDVAALSRRCMSEAEIPIASDVINASDSDLRRAAAAVVHDSVVHEGDWEKRRPQPKTPRRRQCCTPRGCSQDLRRAADVVHDSAVHEGDWEKRIAQAKTPQLIRARARSASDKVKDALGDAGPGMVHCQPPTILAHLARRRRTHTHPSTSHDIADGGFKELYTAWERQQVENQKIRGETLQRNRTEAKHLCSAHMRRQSSKTVTPLHGQGVPSGTEQCQDSEAKALDNVLINRQEFRHFWPLLEASRDYARMSGCRFRNKSFDDLQEMYMSEGSELSQQSRFDEEEKAARLAAKLHANPTVVDFAKRLRVGEPGLLEELHKAFRIQLSESVRNAMISKCRAVDLWPPIDPPSGIAPDDCAFEDVSESLPVIAQRLYNDELRRQEMTVRSGTQDPIRRRALMATFLVDFASAHNVSLPDVPETYMMMLHDFNATATAWEASQEQIVFASSRGHHEPGLVPSAMQTDILCNRMLAYATAVFSCGYAHATSQPEVDHVETIS